MLGESTALHTDKNSVLEISCLWPCWVAQLVRVSPQYANVQGSIPGQGTYKYQSMDAYINGTTKINVSKKIYQ